MGLKQVLVLTAGVLGALLRTPQNVNDQNFLGWVKVLNTVVIIHMFVY